jgi:hypothetical protein
MPDFRAVVLLWEGCVTDSDHFPRRRAWGLAATLALCAALAVSLTACANPLTRVSPGRTATPAPNFCTPPTPDPSAVQAVTAVTHTTIMADWQSGKLAPQDSLDTFARNQAIITAIKVGSNYPGVFTVNNIYCSDGHDDGDISEWQIHVPAKSAGSWITGHEVWVRPSGSPQDVGRVMQTISWDGFLAYVSFLTITPASQAPQSCPAAPSRAVQGLNVTQVQISALTVTQEGVSRFIVHFDSTVRGVFSFFLCRDGATIDEGDLTIDAGPGQYVYQYQKMVRNADLDCPDCDLFGAARWIVTFNHHVAAQAPFIVTQ